MDTSYLDKYRSRHGLQVGMKIMYIAEYRDKTLNKWVQFERTGVITGFSDLTFSFNALPPHANDKWGYYLYNTGDKKGTMLLTTPSLQCISLVCRR